MEKAIIQLDKKECYQLLSYLEFAKKEDFLNTNGQYAKRHNEIRQRILHAMVYSELMTFDEYRNEGGKFIDKHHNVIASSL